MIEKERRPRLILAPGKEKSLERRHPWIFSGAIRRVAGQPVEGDVVDVFDHAGTWRAVGHYQDDSIMVKVLDFDHAEVNEAFWRCRLSAAISYREQLNFFLFAHEEAEAFSMATVGEMGLTNTFRLVNGEGDNMPGLIADYYNGIVVLQAHSEGMHRLFPLFCELLRELLQPLVPFTAVFDKSSATLPSRKYKSRREVVEIVVEEPAALQDGYIWGTAPEEWEMCENGNKMLINYREGQKTGSFLDQRENHALVGSLSRGKRVLNTFGYTGGFSLAALRGGADYVETVDISKKALALCDRNVALNFPDAAHRSVADDVLKYLQTAADNFDVIILDPPAFAKTHRTLQQGLKGYRTINQRAMEAFRPGCVLFTYSCSQAVSRDDFRTMVFSAAALAHRSVRVVRTLPHATDHPVSIYHPEGEYLKGLLLQVE